MVIELDPVDRITAGAVGEPGERTFFLQGRKEGQLVTLLVEKEQVQLLAASVVEILARVGRETGQGPPEDEMDLEEPIQPEWRVGRLSIGYQEDRDLLMLEAIELVAEDEAELPEGDEEWNEPESWLGGLGDPIPEFGERGPDRAPDRPDEHGGGLLENREPERVRFWATREQMLSFARHGAAVCAQGRPRCRLCGRPIEADGHRCMAMNGQREQFEA